MRHILYSEHNCTCVMWIMFYLRTSQSYRNRGHVSVKNTDCIFMSFSASCSHFPVLEKFYKSWQITLLSHCWVSDDGGVAVCRGGNFVWHSFTKFSTKRSNSREDGDTCVCQGEINPLMKSIDSQKPSSIRALKCSIVFYLALHHNWLYRLSK